MFRGSATARIDEKGRLKIPTAFRKDLAERYGREIFITSIQGTSALVYPLTVWQEVEDRLAAMPKTNQVKQRYLERVSYFGQQTRVDAQGRVVSPPAPAGAGEPWRVKWWSVPGSTTSKYGIGSASTSGSRISPSLRRTSSTSAIRGSEAPRVRFIEIQRIPARAGSGRRGRQVIWSPARGGVFVDCTDGTRRTCCGDSRSRSDRHPDRHRSGPRGVGRRRPRDWRFSAIGCGSCRGRFGDLERVVGPARAWGRVAGDSGGFRGLVAADRQGGEGFQFSASDARLDMRMGENDTTAAEIINRASEAELAELFWKYGEERQARRIARAVVRKPSAKRRSKRRSSCAAWWSVPRAAARGRRRGSTRRRASSRPCASPSIRNWTRWRSWFVRRPVCWKNEGRLVMISYHSLEDRLVKNAFRDQARGEVDQITGRPRSETRLLEVADQETASGFGPGGGHKSGGPDRLGCGLRAGSELC